MCVYVCVYVCVSKAHLSMGELGATKKEQTLFMALVISGLILLQLTGIEQKGMIKIMILFSSLVKKMEEEKENE